MASDFRPAIADGANTLPPTPHPTLASTGALTKPMASSFCFARATIETDYRKGYKISKNIDYVVGV